MAEVRREENFSNTEPMSNVAETGASGTPSGDTRNGSRIFITPLSRRLLHEAGIDPTGVIGTGPRGRIRKFDAEAAIAEAHRLACDE